jgi:hypothetical protein
MTYQLETLSVGSMFSYPPSASGLSATNMMLSFSVALTVAAPSPPVVTPLATASAVYASSKMSAPTMLVPSVAPSPVMTCSLSPMFHFAHLIRIKLSPDNYIFWRAQVLTLLQSHYRLGYVDTTLACPPVLVDGVHDPVVNPAYCVWT